METTASANTLSSKQLKSLEAAELIDRAAINKHGNPALEHTPSVGDNFTASSALPDMLVSPQNAGNVISPGFAADARSLFSLLDSIPNAVEQNDLSTLSARVKAATVSADNLGSSPITHLDDGAAVIFVHSAYTQFTKAALFSINTNDKEQKTVVAEQTKELIDAGHEIARSTSHMSVGSVGLSAQAQGIQYKLDLNATSQSAIAVINQLEKEFNFGEAIRKSALSNLAITNELADSQSAREPVPDTQNVYTEATQKYSLDISDYSIITTTDTSNDGINVGGWSGEFVGKFLARFLNTFSNASIASTSIDAFVFTTEASQSSTAPLEQISIHFQDGSNISIIGQKHEIDTFMSISQ